MEQVEALRAVIEAARKWRKGVMTTGEEQETYTLAESVDALEEVLKREGEKRSHGFVGPSTWGEVLPGWFVQTPNNEMWEITGSIRMQGKQHVTLKSPSGRSGTFPRDPSAKVWVRKQARHDPTSEAMNLLAKTFWGTEVIDAPPWDEEES